MFGAVLMCIGTFIIGLTTDNWPLAFGCFILAAGSKINS